MDVEEVPMTTLIGNYENYKTCRKCGAMNKIELVNCWNCDHTDFIPMDFAEAEYYAEFVKVVGDINVVVYKSVPGPCTDEWLHELMNR